MEISTGANIDALIDASANGDSNAFGSLYDLHVDRVYRHIFYRVGSVQDAEDLTQQVFFKAWQAIGKYKKTTSPFIAWLMRISHNLIVDFYRAKKENISLDCGPQIADPGTNPETAAERSLDKEHLKNLLLKLPSEQQQVILMKFVEGFSYTEIAASFNKSEGAIRTILYRGLKKMRQLVEPEKNSI